MVDVGHEQRRLRHPPYCSSPPGPPAHEASRNASNPRQQHAEALNPAIPTTSAAKTEPTAPRGTAQNPASTGDSLSVQTGLTITPEKPHPSTHRREALDRSRRSSRSDGSAFDEGRPDQARTPACQRDQHPAAYDQPPPSRGYREWRRPPFQRRVRRLAPLATERQRGRWTSSVRSRGSGCLAATPITSASKEIRMQAGARGLHARCDRIRVDNAQHERRDRERKQRKRAELPQSRVVARDCSPVSSAGAAGAFAPSGRPRTAMVVWRRLPWCKPASRCVREPQRTDLVTSTARADVRATCTGSNLRTAVTMLGTDYVVCSPGADPESAKDPVSGRRDIGNHHHSVCGNPATHLPAYTHSVGLHHRVND